MKKYGLIGVLLIIISLCAAQAFAAGLTVSGIGIAPGTVGASSNDVGILRVTIVDNGFSDNLNTVIVTSKNTDDLDVTQVKLIQDDGDGLYEPGTDDTVVLTAPFVGGKATFNPNWFILNAAVFNFYVAYDVAPGATHGNILDAQILAGDIIQSNAGPSVVLIDPAGAALIDTVAPSLAEVTPVTTPTNDVTPAYTFSSDEAGAITYAGGCTSGTANAIIGNNPITFNVLADGTYAGCTITVTDVAGNPSAPLSVSPFTIDTDAPTGTLAVNTNPIYEGDLTQLVTVTYDEAMDPLSTPAITFTGMTGATASQGNGLWSAGNTVWTETFNVQDANEETVGVTVGSSLATDAAGNVETASVGTAFNIDTLQPQVANVAVNDNLLSEADVGAGNFVVTVDYNENMNIGNNPTIVFQNPSDVGTLTGCAGVWTDVDTYTYTCNVNDANLEAANVDVGVSGAQDAAGNVQLAHNENDAFDIDTFQPVVSGIVINDNLLTEADVGVGNFVITVDYSEAMNGAVNPVFVFQNPADAGTLTGCAGVWTDVDTYTYTCDVTDADVEAAGVDIQVTGAQDAAGNTEQIGNSLNAFNIDTLEPTVTNVAVSDNLITEVDVGGNFVVTVTYSENMDGAVDPAISFVNPAVAGTFTGCSGLWSGVTTYTYTCTVADADAEGSDVDVQVAGAQDLVGNVQQVHLEADQFDVDTRAPGITDMTGGFPTTGEQFRIWGIAVDTSQIQTITIALNGDVATPPTANVDPLPASTANFEYLVDVNPNGLTFDYTITVVDTHGNVATIGPMNMNIVDNDNPSVVINLPVPGYYNTIVPADVAVSDNIGVQYVKGILEGGSNYEIFLSNLGTWQGNFDIAVMGIADGIYTFRADAYDPSSNNNNSETVAGIVVDTTPPAMNSLTSNITNNITRSDVDVTFTLDVTELYMDTVTLNGQAMTFVGGDIYNYIGTPASLGCVGNPAQDCTVTATATDLAGNVATISLTFKVDDVLPVITILPEDPIPAYNDDDVNISAIVFDSNVQLVTVTEDSTGANVVHNLGDNGAATYDYLIPAANLENQETVTYTFYVIDDAGNEATATAAFTVQNRPPVFNGTIPDITVLEEQAIPGFNVVGYFSDPDFDVLTYSFTAISVDPEVIITVDPVTGDVSFSVTDPDYFGVNTFTISASDPWGGVATSNVVTLTIINVNDAPRLIDPAIALPDMVIPEDTSGSIPDLDAYFYDPDGDAFDYTVLTDEPLLGAEITPGRGVIVTPAPDYYGVSNVHIFANDYLGGIGSDTFQVNVTPVDDAPVINDTALTNESILNLTFMEDFGTFTFDLTPYESDADPYDIDPNLVWTVSGVDPALVTIAVDPVTDVMTITSVSNAFGSDTFTLTLTDSTGLTDTLDLIVTVLPLNDAPYIDPAVPSPITTTEDVPVAYDLGNHENDVDNTDAELVWTVSGVDTSLFTVNAIDPTTDMMIITPVADMSGSDTITLTLTDPDGQFDTQDIVVVINPENDAPVILNAPNTTATQGVLYVYEMEAVDTETDPLTIFSVNDTRFTVTGNRFTWIPTQADVDIGVIDVEFSVTDGDGLTATIIGTITISNVNDNPIIAAIPDQTILEDEPFHYDVDAADPDGDALTYSLSMRPDESMYIDPDTGVIGWLPLNQHVGVHVIEVTVEDGNGGIDTEQFTITVTNTNDQPFFDPALADQTAVEDELFQYDIDATDVDLGDVVSFTSNITVLGGTIDPVTGLMTWVPQNQHVGTHEIGVTVCDDQGQANSCLTETFTITVTNTNDAPIISAIPDQTATEEVLFTYDVIANDPDNDSLTYSIIQGPQGLGIDAATGQIFWVPMNEDTVIYYPAGHLVEVQAADAFGGSDTETFTITVQNVNDAPVILSNAPTTATQGVQYVYEMNATDEDLDPLSYSVNDTSRFSVVGNVFTWIPTQADVDLGSVDVTFTVRDPFGAEDTETVTILVDNTNDAPIPLAFVPNPIIINEDEIYVFSLTPFETDIDNTNAELTWTVTTANPEAFETLEVTDQYINDTLIIQGAQDYSGTVQIQLTLCDIGGLCTPMATSVTVQINPVNDAPEAPALVLPEDGSLIYSSSVQLQWLAATDVDGTVVNYHVYFGTDPANLTEIASTADLYHYTTVEDEQTYYWYVTAEDDQGAVSLPSETWSFTTSLMNAPEIVDYAPELDVVMNETDIQQFTFTAQDVNVPPQALTYTWLLDGVEVGTGIGGTGAYTFSTDYDSAGTYVLTLIVNNTYGLTTELVWNIEVLNLNRPPEFTEVLGPYTVDEDTNLIIDLENSINDEDEDNANLIVTSDSEYNFARPQQELGFRFPEPGVFEVDLIVTDSEGASATQTVTVNVNDVNEAPVIVDTEPESPIVVWDGDEVNFGALAEDPENDELTYTWFVDGDEFASGVDLDDLDYLFELPGNDTRADFEVEVIVSDGEFDTSYVWTVTVTKCPITDTFNGDTTDMCAVDLGEATGLIFEILPYGRIEFPGPVDISDVMTFDGLITFGEGIVSVNTDVLDMLDGEPAIVTLYGLTYEDEPVIYVYDGFTSDTALFEDICGSSECDITSMTTPPTTDGTVVFEIDDPMSFMILSNAAPVITSSAVTSAIIDEAYSYDVDATDADGDAITYSLVTAPTGMTIDAATGLISWTPLTYDNEDVVVRAADDRGAATTQSFTIDVAVSPKLAITDLEVKVGSETDKSIDDGDTIGEDAKPDDNLKFEIEVSNEYTDNENIDIEDVSVVVTIKDIDDGDDIDEESDSEDIKADDKETFTVELDVPNDAEEDDYDVEIEVEGEDENGNVHRVVWELTLTVERERHSISIKDASLSPSLVSCGRDSSIEVEIQNVGQDEEDEAAIRIESSDLGLSISERDIELDNDMDDSDSEFSESYTISIPDDLQPGTYPIIVTAYYDTTKETDSDTVDLVVEECYDSRVDRRDENTDSYTGHRDTDYPDNSHSLEVDVKPVDYPVARPAVKRTNAIPFMESDEYLVLLIALIVLLVGIGIYMVGYVALKRR